MTETTENNSKKEGTPFLTARICLIASCVIFAASAGLFIWKVSAPPNETAGIQEPAAQEPVETPQKKAVQQIAVRSRDGRLEWFDGVKWEDSGELAALSAQDPLTQVQPVKLDESSILPAERTETAIRFASAPKRETASAAASAPAAAPAAPSGGGGSAPSAPQAAAPQPAAPPAAESSGADGQDISAAGL